MANTATQTRTSTQTKPKVEPPRQWHVVLLNDDDHTYDYVIRMVQELFAHGPEKAFKIAEAVDKEGRAVCETTHKERAEFKRDQVLAFGKDPLMASSKGSMSAIIEPADFGDGDGEGGQGGEGGDRPPAA